MPRADNRTLEDFVEDTFAQLKVNVRNVHSRRALLYKVPEDIAKRKDVCLNCETKGAPKARRAGEKTHREHVVPRGVIMAHLLGSPESKSTSISKVEVKRAIELFRIVCVVDKNEEKYLNRTYDGCRAKVSMPLDWSFSDGDPWARYEMVRAVESNLTFWSCKSP